MYDTSKMTEGMDNLHRGYVDYAKEVIISRALPAMLDGLKPANRRLLYTAEKTMIKNGNYLKQKSATLVGETMKIHPHGDASIYETLVPMTDNNGSMALPLFKGQGNFGKFNSTEPAGASRYTEVTLAEMASNYFGELDGIRMKPTEDASDVEPELLPVSFPAVLCNATSGIAVGFSSQIPSFNFNDVLDLTMEYLRTGECKTIICPDFVSGGFYIKNNKELEKLMRTGKAKLKLRGRVERNDKYLTIVELPHGKTLQGIKKQIDSAEIPSIRGSVGDTSDFEHGTGLLVECTSKNRVDETLLALYRDSDLQYTFSARMMTILNDVPITKGVWGIIAEWVKWRRQVLITTYKVQLKKLEAERRDAEAFVTVTSDEKIKDHIVDLVIHKSTSEAVDYIVETFRDKGITRDLAQWIVGRSLSSFSKTSKYIERYKTLSDRINAINSSITNIDDVICAQLQALKDKYGAQCPRRTEISTTDYEFVSEDENATKDTNTCQYIIKQGFLSKIRGSYVDTECDLHIEATASDILIAIDNRGRVLRIYCEDIPYTTTDLGQYLPRYFGFEEDESYRIWWLGKLDGSEKMILYSDGNVGFLKTSEWTGVERKVKVIEKGISVSSANSVAMVFEEVPECLFVTSNSGKLGFVNTDSIKRKNRTAKTRVFTMDEGEFIDTYALMSPTEAIVFVKNLDYYANTKLRYLETRDSLLGDIDMFQDCYV